MLYKAFHMTILELKKYVTPSSLIYFLLAPLLFTFAIGQASFRSGEGAAPEPIRVAVVNQDTSYLGAHLIEQMALNPNLVVQYASEEAALAQVADKEVMAALMIPADLSDKLQADETVTLQFHIDNADEQTQLVEQAINAAASRLIGSLQAGKIAARVATDMGILDAGDSASQQRYTDSSFEIVETRWATSLPIALQVTQITRFEEENDFPRGLNQSSPGMLVMFSMFAFLGGGVMLVAERQQGTLARLITMPVSKISIMLGKLVGIFVVGVTQIVVLILAGVFLFKVDWGQSPVALILTVLSFSLASTSLGILLAAFTRTSAQATALDNVIVLSFSALGGAWWSLEIVPKWMQVLAHALPVAWAMDAFHDIIIRGLSVEAVLPEVGVLLGFAVVFFTIGIWRFRYE